MPKKRDTMNGVTDKLDYLGLDLYDLPEKFVKKQKIEYRVPRLYDEKKHRQYRYINVQDIDILLSPTNRLDSLNDKYKKARPLSEFLNPTDEENLLKHTRFLSMLQDMDIDDVEKVEKEQIKLNKKIPFKVKYEGNYLWQIYHVESLDKYFMIVPTEDTNNATFFYLLKKQIENNGDEKIFVPISSVHYSGGFLKKSELEDIENYLWLFTKDWPLVYEVYDKKDNLSVQIVGETNIYEKIKSKYRIKLDTDEKAKSFYKLLKALFIMQTELPTFFKFDTNINVEGGLDFCLDGNKIEYDSIIEFLREQYKNGLKRKKELKSKIRMFNKKIQLLKEKIAEQEIEYLAKEKQISTFLECKKTFFGKFKYYFKYSKKNNKKNLEEDDNNDFVDDDTKVQVINKNVEKKERKKIPIKKVYTLEELIENYKELENLENTMKDLLLDVNSFKLKTKNMARKIKNAAKYIEEIDKHKKSIFEFWKYSNKDEMQSLPEGEQEEVNIIRKIEKTFDYESDFEEFGKKLDKIQIKNFSKDETDSIFIATTSMIDVINDMKMKKITVEDAKKILEDLKEEFKKEKTLDEEEYDIFGNIVKDSTKVTKINNIKHRELPKDKFSILGINNKTELRDFKVNLQAVVKNILNSLKNNVIPESMPVYKLIVNDELNNKKINIFNINLEKELAENINNVEIDENDVLNLYKLNIKEGMHAIGFTNIIFYDNQNKTLPVGMDLSSKIIVNISRVELELQTKRKINILEFENDKDDFSDIRVKEINVFEYGISRERRIKKSAKENI